MDSSDAIQLAVLLLLLGLSAFFSSAETALTTVNKIRVRTLIEEGDKRALRLEKVLEQPAKMLSAILIGNNIVNMSLSSLGTIIATKAFGSAGAGIATGILTFLVLVFGEITPKTCATLSAEKISLRFAGVIYGWMCITTPLIYIINTFSMGVLKLLRVNPNKHSDAYTENEIRTIVEVSHQDGAIESEERKMINNVFDLDDHLAKDIMVPRVDMTFLNVNASYAETIEVYRQDLFTRLPVYEENRDNILGILNVKDLLLYEDKEHFQVRHILREAYFTHEFKKSSELMMEMRENSISLAIVLDEYGETAGLITLEDILEEIVGEIHDEYDENEEDFIQEVDEREYIVEGSINLDELNDRLELDLNSDEYDSLGGFIIERLDRLPEAGDSICTDEGIHMVVERLDKNRIELVHLYLPEPTPEKGEDSDD